MTDLFTICNMNVEDIIVPDEYNLLKDSKMKLFVSITFSTRQPH